MRRSLFRRKRRIAEFFKLTVTHFDIPGRFNGAPTLVKFGVIGFREMRFGIALHMNHADRNVGVGKEALADGHQTREVVWDINHHAAESTLDQLRLPLRRPNLLSHQALMHLDVMETGIPGASARGWQRNCSIQHS